MEYSFADQPQEVIGPCPELGDVRKTLCPIIKEIDLTDHISKTEYKTTADQSRDQRCEDLAQSSHNLLEWILICFCCGLYRIFAHTLDSGVSGKLIVENRDIISDDDLILAGLCKCSLYTRQILDRLFVRFLRIHKNKTHSCHAVGNCLDVFFPSDES